jgi:hypothetical protein
MKRAVQITVVPFSSLKEEVARCFLFKFLFISSSKLDISKSYKFMTVIYSISIIAPIFVRVSLSFSASSLEMSSFTIVGILSTNFFACTKFMPSNKFFTSLMSATFCLSSNLISFTLNDV